MNKKLTVAIALVAICAAGTGVTIFVNSRKQPEPVVDPNPVVENVELTDEPESQDVPAEESLVAEDVTDAPGGTRVRSWNSN